MWRRTLLAAAVLVAGCKDDGYDPTVPTEMEANTGNGQIGTVNDELAEPLEVRILNREGDPVAGVRVTWTVDPGNGSLVDGSESTTDAEGRAQNRWRLGAVVGTQRAFASVGSLQGSPVNFIATAQAPGGGGGGGGENP